MLAVSALFLLQGLDDMSISVFIGTTRASFVFFVSCYLNLRASLRINGKTLEAFPACYLRESRLFKKVWATSSGV